MNEVNVISSKEVNPTSFSKLNPNAKSFSINSFMEKNKDQVSSRKGVVKDLEVRSNYNMRKEDNGMNPESPRCIGNEKSSVVQESKERSSSVVNKSQKESSNVELSQRKFDEKGWKGYEKKKTSARES